ncbi:hypothetical protein BJ138DRAFT_1143085 [Hygrophoropsis aurantiaca]|uniref:Uncharacterized protein n=1 Tax=Hygrophoropsis aurantiaca TaxID=72124 RepID=A0ACB8AMR6_9AGAM|nr:hypothetical protein BJ138DRAFT_1143085 [Hygrophoropsis aurantiaca]
MTYLSFTFTLGSFHTEMHKMPPKRDLSLTKTSCSKPHLRRRGQRVKGCSTQTENALGRQERYQGEHLEELNILRYFERDSQTRDPLKFHRITPHRDIDLPILRTRRQLGTPTPTSTTKIFALKHHFHHETSSASSSTTVTGGNYYRLNHRRYPLERPKLARIRPNNSLSGVASGALNILGDNHEQDTEDVDYDGDIDEDVYTDEDA